MTRALVAVAAVLALTLPASAVEHQWSVHARTGAHVHLAPSQSAGGVGFSLGLKDTLNERFILGADASYLFLIGNSLSLRAFAGVQRKGLWTPAAFLTATTVLGHRLAFMNAAHPDGPLLPPWSVGAMFAPLRIRGVDTTVSVLEVGVAFGADAPGLALAYQLTLVEISADL